MNSARVIHQVQKGGQKPVALIAGDREFIGYFLARLLQQLDSEVIVAADLETKIEKVDYIFSLGITDPKEIKKLVERAERFKVRIVLAFFEEAETERVCRELLQEKELDWRVVVLGQIYGPKMPFADYQDLVQMIKVLKIRPLFVADAVYALSKVMFGSEGRGRIINLNRKTDLDWKPEVSLEEGLRQTEAFFADQKKAPAAIQMVPRRAAKKSARLAWAMVTVSAFLLILFSPFLFLFFHGLKGVRALREIPAVGGSDLVTVGKLAGRARYHFGQVDLELKQLMGPLTFLGQKKAVGRAQKMIGLGIKASEGILAGTAAVEQGRKLLETVMIRESPLVNQSGKILDLLAAIDSNLQLTADQLSFLQAEIKSDPSLFLTAQKMGFDQSLMETVEKIPQMREVIGRAQKGLQLVPELVGLDKKQTYLVLLQNNMELRPTGGFIGSYALLTFDRGYLLDFEVQDVYVADGQLKGHVEPPEDLKKYLGEAGWYLRDANWEPNFPTSADRAAWFLQKETGRTVDGVIGVNLFLAQKLLGALGEVVIPDYQETISAANVFERAEYHSETNFFPGSTQKKDFLGSLARAVFEKVRLADRRTTLALAKAVYQSLQEKDVLVYLDDRESMQKVIDLGWDGGVRDLGCQAVAGGVNLKCLVDYLMVVESNVGVNKANYFIKRKLAHRVEVESGGQISETLTINYLNQSQADIFPAGRYKNYLRVYAPLGSRLKEVTIKNPVSGQEERLEKEQIEAGDSQGKTFFGFLVKVPVREERTVEISYRLAPEIPANTSVQYLLLVQKQSGVRDEEFDFRFFPPQGATAIASEPKQPVVAGAVAFNPPFDQDLVFEIKVVR